MHDSDCSTNNRGVPELLGPCDCRDKVSQGGEVVEVVAYIDDGGALYTSKLLEIMSVESDGCEPLMTVAQHQRILAAATHPAEQVAGVRLDGLVLANLQMGRVYLHFKTTEQQHAALRELRALMAKSEGVKK